VTATGSTVVARSAAVDAVEQAFVGRATFILIPPPSADGIATVCQRLDRYRVTGWTAYLDSGQETILCTDQPVLASFSTALFPCAGVVLVPKASGAAASLSEALGQPVDPGGEQDVVIMSSAAGGAVGWPTFVVEAVERFDPAAASALREAAARDAGQAGAW